MPITQATVADAGTMAALHAMAFPKDEAWSSELIAGQLGLPGYFGLLHHHGGMLLARVMADEAEILTIAVAPEVRRSGAGSRLVREAIAQARARGATEMFLEVSTRNGPARSVYEKAGFVQVGKRPRYYPDKSDALVLRLGL